MDSTKLAPYPSHHAMQGQDPLESQLLEASLTTSLTDPNARYSIMQFLLVHDMAFG